MGRFGGNGPPKPQYPEPPFPGGPGGPGGPRSPGAPGSQEHFTKDAWAVEHRPAGNDVLKNCKGN